MKRFLVTLWTELWNRVVVSYRSTLTGLGLAILIVLGDQVYQWLGGLHQTWAPILASLVAVALATLKSKKVTADAEAEKEIAKGYATAWVLPGIILSALLIALVMIFAPLRARADDVKYGGCLSDGTTCFAPSLSLSLVAVNLKDGSVTSGVTPGLGYGITWHTDKWYSAGASLNVSFRDTTTGQAIVPSLVGSFANYLRLGLGWQVSSGAKPFLLIGFGSDFASTTTASK